MKFDPVTSRKKIAKHARKLAREAIDMRFRKVNEILKPKPRLMPMFLWKKLISVVIDLSIYKPM